MTEKQTRYEQPRLTSLVTASESTRSFERSLRNGVHRWQASLSFFPYYSPWRGSGIYLEDLYVRPEFRKRGIGTALLAQVAHIAREESCTFIRWSVLDWNEPALNLYASLGACILNNWRCVVLDGDRLEKLARENGRH